jgi:hypothetical protein
MAANANAVSIRRCQCVSACDYWYVRRPRGEKGEVSLSAVGLKIPAGALEGRLVGLKRKPKGLALPLRSDGTIPGLAEHPCSSWRRFTRNHYKAGVRFIRIEFSASTGEK